MVLVLVPLGDGLVLRRAKFADCKDSGQSEYDAEGFYRERPSLRKGYGDLA